MDLAEAFKDAGLMSQEDVDKCRNEKAEAKKKQEEFYNKQAAGADVRKGILHRDA